MRGCKYLLREIQLYGELFTPYGRQVLLHPNLVPRLDDCVLTVSNTALYLKTLSAGTVVFLHQQTICKRCPDDLLLSDRRLETPLWQTRPPVQLPYEIIPSAAAQE